MVRKSLLAVLLLAAATPLAGQQEPVWSSDRPDAQPPLGVTAAHMLESGRFQLGYRFSKMNYKGVWFENDSIPLDETLELYPVAPLTLENLTHEVSIAFAPVGGFTLQANMAFSQRRREQYTAGGTFYVTDIEEVGDLEVYGLFSIFNESVYRAHLQLGALVPTGTSDVTAETPFSTPSEEPVPYDMRPGAGTFAILPGISAQAQNEYGSVGAQAKGTVFFGTNDQDYAPGDRMDVTGWGSYRANDHFSVSARLHYLAWRGIDGADARLDPDRDPGNNSYFLKGERVDLPVGLNFYLPRGSGLVGHRVSFEWIFPLHQEYDAPQLGADWGFVVGWQAVF